MAPGAQHKVWLPSRQCKQICWKVFTQMGCQGMFEDPGEPQLCSDSQYSKIYRIDCSLMTSVELPTKQWCGVVRSPCCVMVNLVWCGGWCLRLMCCGSWLMVLVRQCSVVLLEAYDDGACAYWTSIIGSLSIWGPSFLDKKAESCLGNMILSLSGLNDQDWIDGWLRQPKGFQGHRCFVCLDFSVWFHDPYGLDCLDSLVLQLPYANVLT